jgi:hypothetical protein
MAFQSTVKAQQGAGVVGELALDGPFRGQPAILHTADATLNVVGRACTITSGATGSWAAGSAGAADPKPLIVAVGGVNVFAGILANPKVYALLGTTAGGSLASSLTLPNDVAVELVTDGYLFVALPAASAPGDIVWFLTADGTLVTTAPAAAKPAGAGQYAIGVVERFTDAGASLAVIRVTNRAGVPAGS